MEEFKMCSDGEFMPVSLPCPPPYSGPYYYYPYESIPFPPVDGYSADSSSSSSRGGGAPISAGAVAGIIILVTFIFVMMCVFAVKCKSRSLNILGNIIMRPGAGVGNDVQEHIMDGGHDLQLLSIAGAAAGRGLEEKLVRLLPVFEYVGFLQEDAGKVKKDSSSTECAVCLSSFEDKDIVRVLPKCHHTFHVHCIDTWFQSHANCPLCRERITLQTIQLYFKGPDQLQPPAGPYIYPCDHPPPQPLYPYPNTHQQLPASCDHSVHDQLRPAASLLIPPAGTLVLCANPATVINEGHVHQNEQQYAAKNQNENQPASDDDQQVNDEQSAAGLACGLSLAQGLHLHPQVPAVSTADHHEIDVHPGEPCVQHMNDQLQDAEHEGSLHEERLRDHQKVTAAAAAGRTEREQESSADHDHSELLLLLHATGESDHKMSRSCLRNIISKRSSSHDDQQYYSSGEQKAVASSCIISRSSGIYNDADDEQAGAGARRLISMHKTIINIKGNSERLVEYVASPHHIILNEHNYPNILFMKRSLSTSSL